MQDLWPNPLTTPQDLLEAYIQQAKYAVMNREKPQIVVDELERFLRLLQTLGIGDK